MVDIDNQFLVMDLGFRLATSILFAPQFCRSRWHTTCSINLAKWSWQYGGPTVPRNALLWRSNYLPGWVGCGPRGPPKNLNLLAVGRI